MPDKLLDLTREMSPTPFRVGFKHRGHDHGDYVVLDADGRLVAELETIYQAREAFLFAAAPSMLEALEALHRGEEVDLDAIIALAKGEEN